MSQSPAVNHRGESLQRRSIARCSHEVEVPTRISSAQRHNLVMPCYKSLDECSPYVTRGAGNTNHRHPENDVEDLIESNLAPVVVNDLLTNSFHLRQLVNRLERPERLPILHDSVGLRQANTLKTR